MSPLFWCIAGLYLVLFLSCTKQIEYPSPKIEGKDAVVDIRTLEPGSPRFFTYRHGKDQVRFFVISARDGTMAFLDACAECYPRKLGYEFRDGFFTCRACGVTYSAKEIQTGMGSCYPIRLKGVLKGNTFHLPLVELEQHAGRF